MANMQVWVPTVTLLGTDPLSTTNTSTTVTVTHNAHGFSNGDRVRISPPGTINGIPVEDFKSSKVIANVTANTYEITTNTAATSTGVGGASGTREAANAGGAFAALQYNVNHRFPAGTASGPILKLSKDIIDTYGGTSYIIHYSVPSSPIDNNNLTLSFYPTGGQNYAGIFADVDAAIANARSNNIDIMVQSMSWVKGENSATTQAKSDSFVANMTFLVSEFRKDMYNRGNAIQQLRFIISEMQTTDNVTWPYETAVQTNQKALGETLLQDARFIDTTGFPMLDTIHFTVIGVERIGEAAAKVVF
jgi:hypothetical protein